MIALATEPIVESFPASKAGDSVDFEVFRRSYRLPTRHPSTSIVRDSFDSAGAEDNYEETKHRTSTTTIEDELTSSDFQRYLLAKLDFTLAITKKARQVYEHRIEELLKFALEDYISSDFQRHFLAKLDLTLAITKETRQAYEHRIEELLKFVLEDEQRSTTISKSSQEDFWWFVESMPGARKAALMLLNSGYLSAIWSPDRGTRLEIDFLGEKLCKYVIFTQRARSDNVSRMVGSDSLVGLKKLIQALDISLSENT